MMEGIGAFEVVYGSVDGLVNYLEELGNERDLPLSLDSQVQSLKLELRFLGTMLRCTEMKLLIEDDDCDLLDHVDAIIEAAEVKLSVINDRDLYHVISDMLDKIKLIQPGLRVSCIKQLESTKCIKALNGYAAVVELVDSLLVDLDNLLNYKWQLVGLLKKQMEVLVEKLIFLKATLQFTANRGVKFDKMNDLLNYVVVVARNASCLSYLCWVDEINESMAGQMEIDLSDLLGRMMPMMNPEVREAFIGAMKASKSEQSDTAMNEKLLVTFIDSLLHNLMVLPSFKAPVPLRGPIKTLPENLRFLRTFLEDLPNQNIEPKKRNDLLTHIEGIINDVGWFTYSSCVNEMKDEIAEEISSGLLILQEKVSFIKEEVGNIYLEPLQSMFQNTDLQTVFGHMLAYVGSVIKKLKQFSYCSSKRIAFAKHEIETIQENLKFIRISNWEDCYEAYQAEHVINSFVVRGGPIWYHLLCHVRDLVSSGAGRISKFRDLGSHIIVGNQQMHDFGEIVGFDNDRGVLIYHLTGRLKRLRAVWISGISGTGKTTLAKAIFHDPQIRHHFHYFVWLNVSEIYYKVDMFHEISKQIFGDNMYEMSEEDLSLALYQRLKRCRYLIVIDDMWDLDLLKFLKDVLPDDSIGSRILVTSRTCFAHPEILDAYVHHLCPLSYDESWRLLQRTLFNRECCPAELCSTGEQIAKDCKGHPLAIVCISELLARIDRSQDSWRQVRENLHSYLLFDQRMKLILEENYKQLPDYLKHCFLYLGAFWQENEIPASKLIQLWIAEGFIEQNNQNSPEDEAKAYLMDLIDRSLVIVTKKATNSWIKAVRVHDYFHNICVAKAREEKCWQLIQGCDEFHRLPGSRDRRKLCIYSRKDHFLKLSIGSRHLDSLLFFATDENNSTKPYDVSFICSRFKRLRVLDLERINIGSSLPDGIELLVQLRYLAIHGAMTSIPSSIAKLLNLETLILNGSKSRVELPNTIWKMVRLRHLRLNCPVIFSLHDYNAKDSSQLENLITFYTLPLPLGPDMKKIMGRFPNIQKLRCVVKYSWGSADNCQWFPDLEFLSHLKSLKLSSYGKLQYDNINFPLTLRKLTLSRLGLPWSKISTITGLLNLEVLKLLSGSFEGGIWDMDMEYDGFSNLRFLKLSNLNIEQWYTNSEIFPHLEQLVLRSCTKLEEIPVAFGEILTLEMIEVEGCKESVARSAMRIQDEQQDMGNMDLKVIVNNAA